MSLVLFLLWKSLLSPCTIRSIRNRFLQVRRLRTLRKSLVQEQVIIQEIPQVSTGERRIHEQIVDITGVVMVNPQISNIAVEASAPQVVGSLPLFEEFTAPVYNQVHQEQIDRCRENDPVHN